MIKYETFVITEFTLDLNQGIKINKHGLVCEGILQPPSVVQVLLVFRRSGFYYKIYQVAIKK